VVLYRQLVLRRDGNELMTSTVVGDRYAIGRHADNALPLPDPGASDFHAEIRIAAGRALLTDLGSASGTFVGGVRLPDNEPYTLNDGDVITVGSYEIVYHSQIDRSDESDDAEEPAEDPAAAVAEEMAIPDIAPVPYRRREVELPAPGSTVSRYLQFLPVPFQKSDEDGLHKDPNDFLSRFLHIFETIWEPLEQRQDHIAMFFSPRTCPASWLPWLASWVGIAIDPALPEPRARALIMNAMRIGQWRGTRQGLTLAIEVYLGLHPEIVERPDEPNVFRVRVKLPKDTGTDLLPSLRELVIAHKPAHMGFVIEVQP
jgi:phage tail-like protein